MTLDEYPFRRSMDVRGACAAALARYLRDLDLSLLTARQVRKFTHVYEEWPTQEDKHEPPTATVLPGEGTYEDRALGPSCLEDTWRPDGQEGFVLWVVGEYVVDLDVYFRARDPKQRHAVLGALEDAFVPADLGASSETGGDTYGIVLAVPEYYDRIARFSLRTGRVDDAADTAGRNVREGVCGVAAHIQHCVVRSARPMLARVEVAPAPTGG